MPDVHTLFARVDQRKHTIVGRDKMMFVTRSQNRPPRRADARIHNHYMHGPGREVRIRLRNGKRAIKHVECLYGVADIDDLRLGPNVENDSLHSAYTMVV